MKFPSTFPNLETIQNRLAQVDPALVPRDSIREAGSRGANCLVEHPESLLSLAMELARGKPVRATAFGMGALEAAFENGEDSALALAWLALAIGLLWWGYHYEASFPLQQAADCLPATGLEIAHLYAQWCEILCKRHLTGVPDAPEGLLQIADAFDTLGDPTAAARCRQNAVYSLIQVCKGQEAKLVLEETQAYFSAHGLLGDYAIGLNTQAHIHFKEGKLEALHAALSQAESIFIDASMPVSVGHVWQLRGTYYYHHRQMVDALYWLETANRQDAKLQHKFYEVQGLQQIAFIRAEQGDVKGGLETLMLARPLAALLKLKLVEARSELESANFRLRLGEYDSAEEGYRYAKQCFEEIGHMVHSAICTMNRGIVARRKGNFSLALQLLHESLQVFESEDHYEMRALAHHNLGKTYAAFGYIEPAIEHFCTAIEIPQGIGASGQAVRPTIYLGYLLAQRGETVQAQELLKEASKEARAIGLDKDLATCERVQADILLQEGENRKALNLYQQSLDHFKALGQEEASWNAKLGIAQANVALGHAKKTLRELEGLATDQLPVNMQWRYHTLLAHVGMLQGHHRQALKAYHDALTAIRSARRTLAREVDAQHFVLALQSVYEEAFELALRLDDPLETLAIAETHGGQLISARLGSKLTCESDGDPHKLPIQTTTLLDAYLPEGWTVLRYAWHKDKPHLLTLTGEGVHYHNLNLDAEARMALRACTSPDDSFRRFVYEGTSQVQDNAADMSCHTLQRLCEALLPQEVRSRLTPDHTLIIIPTHHLHGLAFHALLEGRVPLIERTRVLYAPSLELLKTLLEHAGSHVKGLGRGLVLAQSQFEDEQYDPLPHVESEVQKLAQLGKGHVDRVLLNEMSRAKILQYAEEGLFGQYDWLHFATHTYVDPKTGAFSGLLLGEDVLSIDDISHWDLDAHLITLSACQTGLGRWHYGDEIVGLTQTFLSIGAQAVVASLWRADDDHTSGLMLSFYKHLIRGDRPVTALAAAQREAHRAGDIAYHWAPFSIHGQP